MTTEEKQPELNAREDLAPCPNCYIDYEIDSYYSEPGLQAYASYPVLRLCYKHKVSLKPVTPAANLD
jgi:hypothetical protein